MSQSSTARIVRTKVAAKEDKPRRVSPSVFTQEILQSTEERLNNTTIVHVPRILEWFDISSLSHLRSSFVGLDQALFQPYPSELIFQNFSAALTYELPLVLQNNDKVPRYVKLEPLDSDYFHVVGPDSPGKKVACGMTITFTVIFTPQENKDYNHKIFVVTERERFEIPVSAIGPRAILNFRDDINLPVCLAKASTQKTHFIRNVGNCQAKFKVHTQSPFSVTPSAGTLDVDEGIQVTVHFQPMTPGVYKEDMILHYHTGEDVYINLHGVCEEANMELKPHSVWLEKTYISLVSQQMVSLTNESDIPLRYRWTAWPTQHEKDLRHSSELTHVMEGEERLPAPCDPTVTHHVPLQDFLEGCITVQPENRPLCFIEDDCGYLPQEGEIWPKMTVHFDIIFRPKEAKLYQQTLYCDVTGRESMLPLSIKGEGLGPKIVLDYYLRDVKNVFLGDTDYYKVQVMNKGLIDAFFKLSSPETTFGRCFSFNPKEGKIPSGGFQNVEVTFCSRTLGSFSEDLLLTVTGLPQPLILTFRGCVVGPTFHLNISELNFGDVAFGFPVTSTFTLYNTSFVPMTFALRILGDGSGPFSVSSFQQVSDLSRNSWQGHTGGDDFPHPMEFIISPVSDTVEAYSDTIIKVSLCSNTVRRYRLALVVDVEGVGKEILTLPINARCVVSDIVLETPVLDYRRCFINCIRKQQLRLTNPSKLPACYGILDQEVEGNPSLVVNSSSPRGVIPPGSSVEIPLDVCAKAVGRLEHTLKIAVFGSLQIPLGVKLLCVGQGPIVHVQQANLDFGRIPVLTDIVRTLQLSNQSPIPAHFSTRKNLKGSFWHVEPCEGVIPSQNQLEIKVVVNLKDTLYFQGKLEVSVRDSQMHVVTLTATGTGTTIVSDRPLGPSLDLGKHFRPCQFRFKLTNHGKRVHLMYWKNEGLPRSEKSGFLPPISASRQNDILNSSTPKPIFSLSPNRVELFPGCSVDMVLTGSSNTPKVIHERLVCSGIIGQQGCKQNIMTVNVTCQFVAPMLLISPKRLHFFIKKEKGKDLSVMYEKLVLQNVSSLSLTMELFIEEPFLLCETPSQQSTTTVKSVVLADKCQAELWVCFDPAFYPERISRIIDKVLLIDHQGHPQSEVVELHAEVHYPNLHLSSTTVDFGCVINCTKTHRVMTITNCSQLPVSYHWTFLVDQKHRRTDTREATAETDKHNPTQAPPRKSTGSSEVVSPAFSFPDGPVWNENSLTSSPASVDEIFDILPRFGHLDPEEHEEVTFSFYGHEALSSVVIAQCQVDDGPTYEVQLMGEASVVSYSLGSTHLDFGPQLFYQTGEVEVSLKNTGKVGFPFRVLNPTQQESDPSSDEKPQEMKPGWPVVIPAEGHVNAAADQWLKVRYLPGVPEVFQTKIQLQVAFLPPQDIVLTGVGVFPRISLNLPRTDECYGDIMREARAAVDAERAKLEFKNEEDTTEYEQLLQMEVDKLLVTGSARNLHEMRNSSSSLKDGNKLRKVVLPEYVLDFGNVIPGKVTSHSVDVLNSGLTPVSFQADCKHLAGSGFKAEIDGVKHLPCGETYKLTVKLDTQGANVELGHRSAVMLIQVMYGPTVQLQVSAVLTMPAASVSVDTLEFDTVQCGMCQIRTIQLLNQQSLPCQWSIAEEAKPFKKLDKFLPRHKREKLLSEQRAPAPVFEMFPFSGTLSAGEHINIHVKFSPTGECAYHRRLVVNVTDSTQQVWITAKGQGEEPHLEFSAEELELEPCLPLSTNVEAEVKVRNPCSFPIEFYSLEFDDQYLEEEQILRLMPGYDENNILLLPPRTPGQDLLIELYNHYKDYLPQQKDEEIGVVLNQEEVEEEHDTKTCVQKQITAEKFTDSEPIESFILKLSKQTNGERMGEVDLNPVSRAVAKHMGYDLSPEGLAAHSSSAIAMIVYGAPQTDKSSTVAHLTLLYGVMGLSVDAVVTDVLLKGVSPVSLAAQQAFHHAAAEYAVKSAKPVGESTEAGPAESFEASDLVPAPSPAPEETFTKNNGDDCSQKDSETILDTTSEHIASRLGGDVASLQSLLSEQILVDILAERFQSSDCYHGVVINGLESVYTQSPSNTLQVVLKALMNRKHIYVFNISDSYVALKTRERTQKDAEDALQKVNADKADEESQSELDEEKYNALPEEKKTRIIRKHVETLKQQKLRELEQTAKEEEEKREQAEMKRIREEDLQRKSRKGAKRNSKEELPKKKESVEEVQLAETPEKKTSRDEKELNQVKNSLEKDDDEKLRLSDSLCEEPVCENGDADDLQREFTEYEKSVAQVKHVLQYWDRSLGSLMAPVSMDGASPDFTLTEKQSPGGKKSKKGHRKTMSPLSNQTALAEDKASPPDTVPLIVLNTEEDKHLKVQQLLESGILPPRDEVLNDLGLGHCRSMVPPPVTFSVVPFPKIREHAEIQQSRLTFILPEQEKLDEEKKEDDQTSPEKEGRAAVATKSRTASSKESIPMKDKEKRESKSQTGKRQTSDKTRLKTLEESSSEPNIIDQHQQTLEQKRKQRLTKFRWLVPAGAEVTLRIWFYSESPGTFEQTYNFELLGTQKQYHLSCKAVCTYPSICSHYKTLFARCKKVAQAKGLEGLEKTYVIKSNFFEFGPLLCSKTRDRYKEGRYPENSEKLVIQNNSGLEAEVQFTFQHDTEAATFMLDPPALNLKPGEEKDLTVMAYPTKLGQMKDSIVCHIKDNPEVVIINVSCSGVRPELVLENKQLHFDRILLLREDSRSLTLVNKTALPVSWRLQGVDELGDEFKVSQDEGVITPHSSFIWTLYFKAKKPLSIKKMLRLEVSDVSKIVGVVQTESIQISAEAYDVNLAIQPDFCLDFGTIKVFEEAKLSLKIRNQGKYAVDFKIVFERTDSSQPKLDSMFSVSPQMGTLLPREKPTSVLIICKTDKEVFIKEQPILYWQVIDPKLGKGRDVIATPATRISVKSVFSRYELTPACDIDFGALTCGLKKSQSFTIKNTGVFESHFSIFRMTPEPTLMDKSGSPGRLIPRDSVSARPTGAALRVRRESIQRDSVSLQNRLMMGVFSVAPCSGNLQPGAQQQVTVDCVADQLGNWNQGLVIDISGRDPSDHPDGIPYRLLAEVCKPGIALDMASIFEEHYTCHNRSQLSSEQFSKAEGIYVQDENKFVFNNVLVGHTAQARLKLTNNSKVPCVLHMAIRPVGSEGSQSVEGFHLSTTTMTIPDQSHVFVVVSFTPLSLQLYSAVFDAAIEASSRSSPPAGTRVTPISKTKVLEVNLMGSGILPSVRVIRPALRSSAGCPILQFGRVLVGFCQTIAMVLHNDGTVPAQVTIDMLDKHGVFTFQASPDNCSSVKSTEVEDATALGPQLMHQVNLKLKSNETAEVQVRFYSDSPRSVEATMSLQVEDNHYNHTVIEVTGEAYQEVVSLSGISSSWQDMEDQDEGDDDKLLHFGHCCVPCSHQETFIMTNHSSHAVRFEWPPNGSHLIFSPQLGHLHAACSKEVSVTFTSKEPVTLTRHAVKCRLCRVEFEQPVEQVSDWDDRLGSSSVQSVPEPVCSVVLGSQWEVELRVSALCEYAQFSCNTQSIIFEDTMLYQTKCQELQIVNEGRVNVEFSWEILMACEQGDGVPAPRPSHLADVVSHVAGSLEEPPFAVEPSCGVIKPAAVQSFSMRFSPLVVAHFQGRLVCSIPNLQDEVQPPSISICGLSLLPHCHFDLEDSDYISGNRRSSEFSGSLEPNTKVLEFTAVGFTTSRRSFTVLNPTAKPYTFKWRCEDRGSSHFRCLTPCGNISPGQKAEVTFEYLAEQMEPVESQWSFMIDTLSLSVPFLCVGTSAEPLIYLDRPHLDFGELLVGHRVEQNILVVNEEEQPFSFSVQQSSLLSEEQDSVLLLQPMCGKVGPKKRLPLSVSFTPSREGCVRFKLLLRVKKRSALLTLPVKAECFTIRASLQVEKLNGDLQEIDPNHQDTLDFGKVGISEQSVFRLFVTNLAKFNIDVNIEIVGTQELLQHLQLKPQKALVNVGEQLESSLFFCPGSICILKDIKMLVKVRLGPVFTFQIKGRAVEPSLEFSFTKHNFGTCFLYSPDVVSPSHSLMIHNKGTKDISIQSQFKNTPFLEMDFQANILSAGAVMKVLFTFYPREAIQYSAKIPFILNSCVTKEVHIFGQGLEIKLEVEEPLHRKVNLGTLMVGQKVKKQVGVVNHSSRDLHFMLVLNANTPVDPKDLSVYPADKLKLKPNTSCKVDIHFSPRQHIPRFTAELLAGFPGLLHPLLTVDGCCQDVEVLLDPVRLSFGAVVLGCKAKKTLLMTNPGDIDARFHWRAENFPKELSITPTKGCICPGMKVPLELTFAPINLSNNTRYENLCCSVEGCLSPPTLTVTGSCVTASTHKEVMSFVCPVRGSHTLSVSVLNPTNQQCSIRPVVEGKQWRTPLLFSLEPHQHKTFEIIYQPLTMTTDGDKHKGSVLFSFPDGTGMLYVLQGTALPPKAEDSIVNELPAKTQHSQLLPVHNWLRRDQRFSVLIEPVKPDKLDATVSISGLSYFDVAALAKRDYSLSFSSYKEGQYTTKVTFKNMETSEYLFYIITFKVTPPGALSAIKLDSTVRRTTSATVEMENPLSTATSLIVECKSSDIRAPSQHTVPGQSKGALSFEYHPPCEGESTARLTLFSNDLGHFHYDLLLRARPAPPEKTVCFSTSLGSSQLVVVKFLSYSYKYSYKTDCPDYKVEKSVSASPGSEASLDVCYEPHRLGETRGQLTVCYASGGEYVFPLHGVCLPPKVQGPFSIRAGQHVKIPFKNVFLETTTFVFQVESPLFTVKAAESMLSKKTQNIQVGFEAPPGGSVGPWCSRLTVTSQSCGGQGMPCSWVYYLKGYSAESA